MGAKRFGAEIVSPGTEKIIMSGQTGYDSTVVVTITNQGTTPTNIFLAYMDSTNLVDLSNEDYLVYNRSLGPGSYLEVKGIAVEEGHSLVVSTTTSAVSAIAYGIEDISA